MPFPNFRSLCVQCLVEISSIDIESEPKYGARLDIMFRKVMSVLADQLPIEVDLAQAYANGSNEDQQLISNLAQFLSTYLNKHSNLCEVFDSSPDSTRIETKQAHSLALQYLLKISEVEDTEVFKVSKKKKYFEIYAFVFRFALIIGIGSLRNCFVNLHLKCNPVCWNR